MYIIDTHILLWLLSEPDKLSEAALPGRLSPQELTDGGQGV